MILRISRNVDLHVHTLRQYTIVFSFLWLINLRNQELRFSRILKEIESFYLLGVNIIFSATIWCCLDYKENGLFS